MKKIIASAPGKIHILGEHTVVYGKPALLAAVNKRCRVTISTGQKNKAIEISSDDKTISITREEIVKKTMQTNKLWEQFTKSNDSTFLKQVIQGPLDYAVICIGETAAYYMSDLPASFSLNIHSEIPSGMGSSGALAVSIVAAVSALLGHDFNKKSINTIAYSCEQKVHGNASGGDNTTSCFGGFVWYRKETESLKLMEQIHFKAADAIAQSLYFIDTGKPSESTGEMVDIVRKLKEAKPALVNHICEEQEQFVKDVYHAFENNESENIKHLFKMGQKNLARLGVVSKYVKKIIRSIEESGGSAKIVGGGGIQKSTGVLLIFHNNRKALDKSLSTYKIPIENVEFANEGVIVNA